MGTPSPMSHAESSKASDAIPPADEVLAEKESEQDDDTAREGFELEMMEEGRSEEAGHAGDHIG